MIQIKVFVRLNAMMCVLYIDGHSLLMVFIVIGEIFLFAALNNGVNSAGCMRKFGSFDGAAFFD